MYSLPLKLDATVPKIHIEQYQYRKFVPSLIHVNRIDYKTNYNRKNLIIENYDVFTTELRPESSLDSNYSSLFSNILCSS